MEFDNSTTYIRRSTGTVSPLVTITSTGVFRSKEIFQEVPEIPEAFSILFNGIHTVVSPVLVSSLIVSVPLGLVPTYQMHQLLYSYWVFLY
jgi:hypothetical protein